MFSPVWLGMDNKGFDQKGGLLFMEDKHTNSPSKSTQINKDSIHKYIHIQYTEISKFLEYVNYGVVFIAIL